MKTSNSPVITYIQFEKSLTTLFGPRVFIYRFHINIQLNYHLFVIRDECIIFYLFLLWTQTKLTLSNASAILSSHVCNFNQLRENLVLLKIKPICLHLVSLSYVLANVMDIFRYIYDEFDTCEHHFYFPFRKKSRRFSTSTNKTFKLEEGGGRMKTKRISRFCVIKETK